MTDCPALGRREGSGRAVDEAWEELARSDSHCVPCPSRAEQVALRGTATLDRHGTPPGAPSGQKGGADMISAKISNEMRKAVYRRDGYRCALCDSTKYIQVHHCIKRSRGGTNSVENLVTLCADCHALAHGMNLNDWDATQKDVEQAIVEYLADYYAPDWNPWAKDREPWRREP